MKKVLTELKKIFGENRIREHEPMSSHTTFKIGGPAEYYIDISMPDEIVKAVQITKKLGIPFFIFGGGSNIIVSDKGIEGLTVKNNCRRFEVQGMVGRVTNQKVGVDSALIFAESGVIMNQLVRFAIDEGLEGLEYQLGLPGTVGGGICMNSNFPKENAFVGDCLYRAKILNRDGEVKDVERSYFHFAYDASYLQESGEIVLSVLFKLKKEQKDVLWERATRALAYRSETQPKGASAGCTFRNIGLDAVRVSTPTTSAGYFIDKAGLKGKRVGDAMTSEKHANFILNMGSAKAEDVVSLVTLIKSEVHKKFDVELHLEVKTIGF